jgi:hypothetical protein
MPIVELPEQEWQVVMALISAAPWRDANPLLMKIGGQLNAQHQAANPTPIVVNKQTNSDGKEASHE